VTPYPRAAFAIAPGVTHLAAGGEPPWLLEQQRALDLYAAHKSAGYAGRDSQMAELDRVRAMVAADWQVPRGDIGFVSSVAEGVSMLAESLDLAGGNIVAARIEYASMLGPFARRADAELRLTETLAGIAQQVDRDTRIILVSDISQLTGEAADLPALREAADRVGAALIIDYTQAAGWKRIAADIADFSFSACYRWLLGTTGIAIAHWNQARQPGWAPRTAGWFNLAMPTDWAAPVLVEGAARFCRGNPAFLPLHMLGVGLDFAHRSDAALLESHVLRLAARLRAGVLEAGLPCLTPGSHGANICIPHATPDAVVARLHEQGVMAWGGRGRVRFSLHGYNDAADVAAALAALQGSLTPIAA